MTRNSNDGSKNDQASDVVTDPNDQTEAWWLKRLKEHPFKALSLAISIYGGLVLLAFFVWLGSMPELDLAGAAATLAAVAVIGLLVVVALAITTIAAGVATRSMSSDAPHLTTTVSLLMLALPGGLLILCAGVDAAIYEAVHFSVWWIGVALVLSIMLPIVRATWLTWRHCIASKSVTQSQEGSQVTEELTQVAGSVVRPSSFTRWEECFINVLCGFMWLASALMAVLSYFAMSTQSSRSNWEFGLGLVVWGLASLYLNALVVGVRQKMQWAAFIAIGAASVLVVTMLAANWSAIPVAVVRVLGLGDVVVGAVVTEDGCAIFNKAARGQKVCEMDAAQKLGWVCPVILKSRVGAPLVFELQSFGENGSWPISAFEIEKKRKNSSVNHQRYQHIQLPKADVKSWPSIEPLPRHKESSASQSNDPGSPKPEEKEQRDQKSLSGVASPLLASYLNQSYEVEHEEQQKWLSEQCGAAAMKR